MPGATGMSCPTAFMAASSTTRTTSGSRATATASCRSIRTTARLLPILQIGTRGFCDNPLNPAAIPPVLVDGQCGNSGGNPLANMSHTLLNQPANMYIDPNPDPVTGERGSIYIADGYGNHRVVVFSAAGIYLQAVGRAG